MVAAFKLTTQQAQRGWGGGRAGGTTAPKAAPHPAPVMKRVEGGRPKSAPPPVAVGQKLKVVNGDNFDAEAAIPFQDEKDSDVLRNF
jgi:hypothetical protein